jgi:hypothetical protein
MPDSNVPPFHGNISFNAQHSPMGAFMSFTCGQFGTCGGFGLQIGKPGNQDLYIGVKEGDRFSDAPLKCLPFFQGATPSGADAFLVEQAGPAEQNVRPKVVPYRAEQIRRRYGWATDRWETDDFEFAVYTPFGSISDPTTHAPVVSGSELIPGVTATLMVDNRHGAGTRTLVFAIKPDTPGYRPLELGAALPAFAWRRQWGIAATSSGGQRDPFHFCRFSVDDGLRQEMTHQLGAVPGVAVEALPGERVELRISLGCFLEDLVTTRLEGRYFYTRFFHGLQDVLLELQRSFPGRRTMSHRLDDELMNSGLSPDQQFLIAHATRSYYGSTQLLDVAGQPFWVVNEGEYCMMNTLDLSVDQMFWELKHNPWVVRNVLDNFVRYYSYHDEVKLKDEETEKRRDAVKHSHCISSSLRLSASPGGISFCHDMGAHNNFSPFGHSSYELADLTGCFSYMTAEQLCNWSLMAATYVNRTDDLDWARQNVHVITACLSSLVNRGGDFGFVQFDSSRCGGGSEITTYDSLDHSLAQTRNNVYMAVKSWASYLGLAMVLEKLRRDEAATAREQLTRIERVLAEHVGVDGVFPAVFEEDNPGYGSRILPAVEGLMYPHAWGVPLPQTLVKDLKEHALTLLRDPQQRNLFPDGGIRLSSTSDNSWMSKIAIFQHLARRVLRLDDDPKISQLLAKADAAHVKWQTDGSGYWACSDQFVNGIAKGSRYYPRIITTALWME